MKHIKRRKTIPAAVSIDEDLYTQAIRERISTQDTNFSRYVRELIRADLKNPQQLEHQLQRAV